jgi:hypothetical protein
VDPWLFVELVGVEAPLARPAIHHGVGEVVQVPARLPDAGVHQDRRVEPGHVAAAEYGVAPPQPFDVPLQLDAERPIVPA